MLKISIITATFNAATTIRDCLESVQNQSHPRVEHIIIDAASSDTTPDILQEYKADLSQIISEPDKGIYDGMNKGLRLATGDIVGLLNGDDYYPSDDVLAKVGQVFERENVDTCYGDLVYIAEDNDGLLSTVQGLGYKGDRVVRYWKSGAYDPRKFYWGWMPPHPTFFVRRDVYEKYGLFNLELGSAADYEIMLRFLIKYRVKAAYIPEVLVKMRTGGVSTASVKNRLAANRMDRKAWQVNGLKPYPWTLWMKPMRKVGQWFVKTG